MREKNDKDVNDDKHNEETGPQSFAPLCVLGNVVKYTEKN